MASLIAPPRPAPLWAVAVLVFAALAGAINFGTSFLQRRPDASGYPGIGTMAVVIALFGAYGSRWVALTSFVVLAIDTGGAPWFLIATWRDRSFWDRR